MNQPTAGTEVQKANVEAVFDLAVRMVDAGDKLTQLSFEVTRSMLTQVQKNTLAALCSKEMGEVAISQARQAESLPDAAVSYARKFFEIANYVQAEMTRCAQANVDAYKERMQTFIDQVEKNAPSGSEATVSAWKSAMDTTRSFYETMQKNFQPVAQIAGSDLPEVVAKATRRVAGQASATTKE